MLNVTILNTNLKMLIFCRHKLRTTTINSMSEIEKQFFKVFQVANLQCQNKNYKKLQKYFQNFETVLIKTQ